MLQKLCFLFLLGGMLVFSQTSQKEFEQWYKNYYNEWVGGEYLDLDLLEQYFAHCPDKTLYPYYFYYKTWIFIEADYPDLALKNLYLAEHYFLNGADQSSDSTPYMEDIYHTFANLYMMMDEPEKVKEALAKGRAFLAELDDEERAKGGRYDLNALEAYFSFYYGGEKTQVIDRLLSRYKKDLKEYAYPTVRMVTLMDAFEFTLEMEDDDLAQQVNTLVEKDPYTRELFDLYLLRYYQLKSKYHLLLGEYSTALHYNDSMMAHPHMLDLIKKEEALKRYISIYDSLGQLHHLSRYKDSLNALLVQQNEQRVAAVIDMTEENRQLAQYNIKLEESKKEQAAFLHQMVLLIVGILLLIFYLVYRTRKQLKGALVQQIEKVNFTQEKYLQLLKEYQLEKKHFERIKKSLNQEMETHPSPKVFSVLSYLNEHKNLKAGEDPLDVHQFEEEFTTNLKRLLPALTPFEVQLCYFFKLNFSIREITKLTKLTYKSIESHKYRLTRKIKAEHQASLTSFLEKIPLQLTE